MMELYKNKHTYTCGTAVQICMCWIPIENNIKVVLLIHKLKKIQDEYNKHNSLTFKSMTNRGYLGSCAQGKNTGQ